MSWQSMGGRFLVGVAKPRTAGIVNGVAVAVFAGLLAHWTWGVVTPSRPERAHEVNRVQPRKVSLAVLFNSHLFGRPTSPSLAAIPISHLALTLSGLVAGDPGVALIGQAGRGVRPYVVGASIAPGVVLAAVTADRAIVRQNGRLESLLLYPPQGPQAMVAPSEAPSASAPTAASPEGSFPRGTDVIAINPSAMTRLSAVSSAQLQSWLTPGREGGMLVKKASGRALSILGLRPGDIIEEINGRPVNSVGSAISAYMAGAKAGSIRADVARNGHLKVFEYRLQGQ